jgi:hypothetical protein
MQAMVKTRREFHARSGEWSTEQQDSIESLCQMDTAEPSVALLTFDRKKDNWYNIVERYANAVALGAKKNFARIVGLVEGLFGREKVTYLVDSGSELNLITRCVWEQAGDLEIDKDSNHWTLQGLGGSPVQLIGCVRDAPIQLAGKNFDHHFFVSSMEHGPYDGIFGQPWLDWFSVDVSYNRGAPTYLQAFSSGDKTGPYISVEICPTDHLCNADQFILTGEANGPRLTKGFWWGAGAQSLPHL